jgi:hypothetical protein
MYRISSIRLLNWPDIQQTEYLGHLYCCPINAKALSIGTCMVSKMLSHSLLRSRYLPEPCKWPVWSACLFSRPVRGLVPPPGRPIYIGLLQLMQLILLCPDPSSLKMVRNSQQKSQQSLYRVPESFKINNK